MSTVEKIFCGSGKIITTQYGDMVKVSFSKEDLEKLTNALDNGWVNTVLKEKKNKVEGKPTHYLEVDTWKPTEAKTPVTTDTGSGGQDLPF